MAKLLTVITSTYNKGDRNRNSIQSVLDQSFTNFDYIIVDDGSTDQTKSILEEFTDPRIIFFHQENKGFTNTMISVMNQVETPFVAIQGAGDISFPTRFEKQIECLQNRLDVGVVACNKCTSLIRSNVNVPRSEFSETIEYNSVHQMIDKNIVNHGEAMIRMSAYRDAGGYRPFFRYTQDRDLWLRILEKYSIVRLGSNLYQKVIEPKTDICGNFKRTEHQALYSMFALFLARERLSGRPDPLDVKGAESFVEFIHNLDKSEKQEVARRIYNSINLNKNNIDEALAIILYYDPNHQGARSIQKKLLIERNIPHLKKIYSVTGKLNRILTRGKRMGRKLIYRS